MWLDQAHRRGCVTHSVLAQMLALEMASHQVGIGQQRVAVAYVILDNSDVLISTHVHAYPHMFMQQEQVGRKRSRNTLILPP